MSHGSPDLSDRTADLFITTEKDKRGFIFESLYQEELFPVCSQTYMEIIKNNLALNSNAELEKILKTTPSALAQFPLITAFSIYGRHTEDWRRLFEHLGTSLPTNIQFHRFSHLMLAYEAAKHSLGIALVNDYMLNDVSNESALMRLPCSAYKTDDNFHLVYKESRKNEKAIQYLKNWLQEETKTLSKAHRPVSL